MELEKHWGSYCHFCRLACLPLCIPLPGVFSNMCPQDGVSTQCFSISSHKRHVSIYCTVQGRVTNGLLKQWSPALVVLPRSQHLGYVKNTCVHEDEVNTDFLEGRQGEQGLLVWRREHITPGEYFHVSWIGGSFREIWITSDESAEHNRHMFSPLFKTILCYMLTMDQLWREWYTQRQQPCSKSGKERRNMEIDITCLASQLKTTLYHRVPRGIRNKVEAAKQPHCWNRPQLCALTGMWK